jgi:hypothetical protein
MSVHLKDNSEAFLRAVHEAGTEQSIPIPELFTDEFLMSHTRFTSCDEMFQYLLTTNNVSHPNDLTREQMDAMAVVRTSFSNWNEMLGTAYGERIKSCVARKLNQT